MVSAAKNAEGGFVRKWNVKTTKWLIAIVAFCVNGTAPGFYYPNLGRWTTRDPIEEEDTPNLYTFVKNSVRPSW